MDDSGSGFFDYINPANWFGGGDTTAPSTTTSTPSSSPSGGAAAPPSSTGTNTSSDQGFDFTGSSAPFSFFGSSPSASGAAQPSDASLLGVNSPSVNSFLSGGATQSALPGSAIGADVNYNSGVGSATGAGQPGQAPAPPAAPKSTMDSILSSLGMGKANPLGVLASAGGLAYDAVKGNQQSDAQKSLGNLANSQNQQGQLLQSYLTNGTLPPGAQQWVDNQTSAQKAAIRSKYAQMGMSGSTAETQDLNGVDQQASSYMFQIASELLNTGISETSGSGTLYNYLMQQDNADQKQVSDAITNFVSALGGSSGQKSQTLTLNS